MNFLSGRGAEEPTVYGWNTKVSAPLYLELERESKEIEWKSEKERQTENEIRIGETNIQMFVSAQFTQRTKNTQYICIL